MRDTLLHAKHSTKIDVIPQNYFKYRFLWYIEHYSEVHIHLSTYVQAFLLQNNQNLQQN